MKKIILCFLLVWPGTGRVCFADTIFLKNGKVLEGKLKENQPSAVRENWCSGPDEVELVEEFSSQCLKRHNIERVEMVVKEPEGAAALAVDGQWGEEENGYRVQLIPASAEYTLGQPMKVHLVMKNVSGMTKWYELQAIGSSLQLTDPDGRPVLSKRPIVQTMGSSKAINPQEIVVLLEDVDITRDFVISRPGKYTLQSARGNYGFTMDMTPASNPLALEVKPGQVKEEDLIIESLRTVLPGENWTVSRGWGKFADSPAGRYAQNPEKVIITGQIGTKSGIIIQLWQTAETAIITTGYTDGTVSEYLGSAAEKHYYVLIPAETVLYWPAVREDLMTALKISQ